MTAQAVPTSSFSFRSALRSALAVLGFAFLILFALIETVPFVLTVANSFKCLPATREASEAFIPVPPFWVDCRVNGVALPASATTAGFTFNPTLEGYQQILRYDFGRWFGNSVIYSVSITILRVLFDSLAGYALARLKFPGKRLMFFIILGTLMIPGIVLLIPRFIILQQLGLLGTDSGRRA
jgi:multiple sugar transport system permease protein